MNGTANEVGSVRPYPVKFYAIPMERVWGGHSLKTTFATKCDVSIPEGAVGEYWVLSGHPNGTSAVSNGPYQGLSLVELTQRYPKDYLGQSVQPRFPLLIKFLEASDDLSVQVHPTDEMAQAVEGDYGKTEAWYVLECPEDGRVVYGHSFASRDELLAAQAQGTIGEYLEYREIHPRDTVFVPSKTLHALLAGTKVIEVQQTSDVTYRVYDWDRMGQDGKPRALHVHQAADVLFGSPDSHEEPMSAPSDPKNQNQHRGEASHRQPLDVTLGETKTLVQCNYFDMYEWNVKPSESAVLNRHTADTPDVIIVVEGHGTLTWNNEEVLHLDPGDTCLVPTSLPQVTVQCSAETDTPLSLIVARY